MNTMFKKLLWFLLAFSLTVSADMVPMQGNGFIGMSGGMGTGGNRSGLGFRAYFTDSIQVANGIGTFTPPSNDTTDRQRGVLDFEGVWRYGKQDEVLFGGRRVENLITASEDMTDAAYTDENSAVSTATQTTYDGTSNGQVAQVVTVADTGAGRTFIFSVKIKLVSGTISADSALQIGIGGNAVTEAATSIGGLVDGTTQRFSITATTDAAGTQIKPRVRWNDSGVLEITEWQLEESTGRLDTTTPSEYVSTGVGTGDELVINGTFDSDITGWVDNSSGTSAISWADGTLQFDVGDNATRAYQAKTLVDGATYAWSVDNTVFSGATTIFRIGTTTVGQDIVSQNITATGTYKGTFIAANTTVYINLFTNNTSANINWDNISLKRIDHGANVDGVQYFNYENPNTVTSNVVTDSGTRTQLGRNLISNNGLSNPTVIGTGGNFQDNLGDELVTNGGFDTDTDWAKGAGWGIAAGVASCDGTQTSASNLTTSANPFTEGVTYLVTFIITNYAAGNLTPYVGASGAGTARSANGTYTEVITSSSGTQKLYMQADADFIGDIDNVSVKEVTVGATGWTANDSEAIVIEADGNLRITNGDATKAEARTTIATEAGKTYSVFLENAYSLASHFYVGSTAGGSDILGVQSQNAGSINHYTFTAIGTTTHITLAPNTTALGRITEFGGIYITPGIPLAGLMMEGAATNLFLNSTAPVTQDITLSTGLHTVSVHGTGTVTSSDNTATSTGHGAASDGTPITFNVSVGGSVTFTVSGSPDYVQVETGGVPTSPIVTAGTSVTRPASTDATIDDANLNDPNFTLTVTVTPNHPSTALTGTQQVITLGANAFLSYNHTSTRWEVTNGTTTATVTGTFIAGQSVVLKIRGSQSANELQISADATAGTAVAYSGSLPAGNITFAEMGGQANFKNVEIYRRDKGAGWLVE